MKIHSLKLGVALSVLFTATAAVKAGPAFDSEDGDLLGAEPADMEIVRGRDGTVTSRETYVTPDGSRVTRMTVREPAATAAVPVRVELTPSQRRLIWHTVAVPTTAADEPEFIEMPGAIVREHIEAVPVPRSYRVGTYVPDASLLQPLPDAVTIAVPTVQDHLYTVVGERVLVVDPLTNTVVAEVAR